MFILRNNSCYTKQPGGFVALISVLVVGAAGVAVAVSLLLLGVGAARTSIAAIQSQQGKSLANACAEEALERVREKTSFTGNETIALGLGTCNFAVTSQGGENRTVTASGTVGGVVRKTKIIINKINPTIQVVSWQEVADF